MPPAAPLFPVVVDVNVNVDERSRHAEHHARSAVALAFSTLLRLCLTLGLSILICLVSPGAPPTPTPPPSAPRWAVLSRDILLLMRQTIQITLDGQDAQGSYSNGTDPDNDVEQIPPFNGFYLLTGDNAVVESAARAADWLWEEILYRGFDGRGTNECHHGGELSWNCYPFTMSRYGESKWVSRVNTMTELLPQMTGITDAGRRHFKSFHWSGMGHYRTDYWKGVDVPENARYMPAFNYAVWLDPEIQQQGKRIRDLLLEHGNAWHSVAMSTFPNKPYGVVPYEVVFPSGQVAGHSGRWWAMKASLTSPSSDFNWDWRYGMVAPRSLYYQFLSDYLISGDAKYLQPVEETIRYFFVDQAMNGIPPAYMNIYRDEDDADGSWPVLNHLGNGFTDILAATWRKMTGNPRFDAQFVRQAERTLELYGPGSARHARLDRGTLAFDPTSWQFDNGPTTPLFLAWAATGDRVWLERCLEWVRESYELKLARGEGGAGTFELAYLLWMYTGGASPAKRIYPHNAFSWEQTEYRLAVLLLDRAPGHVRFLAYNFGEGPLSAQLRVWEMKPGLYRIRQGPDADGDDAMDFVEQEGQTGGVVRGTRIGLPIPPQTLTVYELDWLGDIGASLILH